MRIDLNLATRPFVNRVPHALLLGALGTAAVALTAWNAALWLGTRAEARAVESQLQALEAETRRLERRGASLRDALARVDLDEMAQSANAADQVLAERAVSWTLLLERLEETLPWSAALQSIRTRVGADAVDMELELRARTQDHYLEFIDTLEASPCFSDVYPGSELKAETSGEFLVSLQLVHDPSCGTAPPEKPAARRGGRARRTTRG